MPARRPEASVEEVNGITATRSADRIERLHFPERVPIVEPR
jgi:hypothetical protein